jgi:hypothetical protein
LTGDDDYREFITPIMFVSAVTLIHHESDLSGTAAKTTTGASAVTSPGSGVASGTGKPTGPTGTAASTSNAAVRLAARGSSWNGFGAVLGVSLAAAALGAAIVLPF